MRLTEFWERMREQFDAGYVELFARDHVIAELGNRTVDQALHDGVATKDVWRAVCEAREVPMEQR